MYIQLFCEFRHHGVRYCLSDFGIGENGNFRFDHFYDEDFPHIFGRAMWVDVMQNYLFNDTTETSIVFAGINKYDDVIVAKIINCSVW